jgi:hypothetical protein
VTGPPNQQSGGAVPSCWFCLSNPNVDVQLVAAIGTTCYLALDKGALSWGPAPHVLVIPIDHHGGVATLPPETRQECEGYIAALRRCYLAQVRGRCEIVNF